MQKEKSVIGKYLAMWLAAVIFCFFCAGCAAEPAAESAPASPQEAVQAVLTQMLAGPDEETAALAAENIAEIGIGLEQDEDAQQEAAAALQEQDFIALRHVHQLAELGLGVVKDLLEDLGAVAHLHDGHTGAVVVGDLSACTLEDLQRQHGRASGEVKYTIVSHRN